MLTDRNGNLWAWWDPPGLAPGPGAAGGTRAVVTGSHLDSVPDGGAFDGPLGVVSAFAAVNLLRERGCLRPARWGSRRSARRKAPGSGSPAWAAGCWRAPSTRVLPGRWPTPRGSPWPRRWPRPGTTRTASGPIDDLLAAVGAYVELHVEQGRALADLGAAIAIGEQIWPHGRWRLDFTGRPDHAGTAALADRRDPMLPFAAAVLAARQAAAARGALATVGKVTAEPGAVNAVGARVSAWLDARGPDEQTLQAVVGEVLAAAREAAAGHGVELAAEPESVTPGRGVRSGPAREAGVLAGRRASARRCCPPARATTRACWPRGCRPRCCSCATRPGCRTRPPSTPSGRLRGRGAGARHRAGGPRMQVTGDGAAGGEPPGMGLRRRASDWGQG